MRRLALVALLVLLMPTAAAQPADGHATLTLDVQPDHSESMTLTFEGLRPLTEYHGLCLPARATESRVHDDVGDLTYEAKDENDRRVISFLARRPSVSIEMARPAPAATDAPLFTANVNFCIPEESTVEVQVRVPEQHTLFFMSDHGAIAPGGRSASARHDGPTHVFYSYEAPLGDADLQVIDEGPFRVFVSPPLAAPAREVARGAAAPYDAALTEAGLTRPFDTLRVLYSETTPFEWEAGHYNGHGYVQVKESSLDTSPKVGYPYTPTKLLVHEGFHAASFPYGQGDVDDTLAWWLEGTARHAERQVDRMLPNATTYCERSAARVECWNFDDRLNRTDIDTGYRSDFTFSTEWEPSAVQSDDTRHFYYGYSEFIVGAWIAQNGEPSYRAAWDRIGAAFDTGAGCPCDDGWLESVLSDESLLRPWNDVRQQDPAGFEARVKPFVRDQKAFEDIVDAQSDPLAGLGIPAPAWLALVAVLGAALVLRRR